MSRIPRCQTAVCIDHCHLPRGLRAAPVRSEEVQRPFYFGAVTTYIENPQGLLNLHLPHDGACPSRPRVTLPEIVDTGRVLAGLQVGLDGTYGPDPLVTIDRAGWVGMTYSSKLSIAFLAGLFRLSMSLPSVAVFNTWHARTQYFASSTNALSSAISS